MKTLFVILGSLLGLFFVALLTVGLSLDAIVKRALNRYGPRYTQTTVQIGSVHVSLWSGGGSLSGLVVGNPAGWTSDHAISVGKIALAISPTSLLGDHVVINSLVIEKPDIVYETKLTSSNLQDLSKNLERSSSSAENTPVTEKKKPVKLEVRSLRLEDAKITVIAEGRTQVVTIPNITMENLGTAEGGITPARISVDIVKEITRQSLQAATRGLFNADSLNKLSGKASSLFRKLLNHSQEQSAPTSAP